MTVNWRYKSRIDELLWPAMPTSRGAAVMAMLQQLEESQWWTPEALREHQNLQLALLLTHAFQTVPYYREQWRHLGGIPDPSSESWLDVPLLTRAKLQQAGRDLFSRDIPKHHGKSHLVRSSGSLGMPVTTLATDVSRFFWDVFTMRDHRWHRRDLQGKLAILRYVSDGKARYPEAVDVDGWGCVAGKIVETGPAKMLSIFSPVEKIAEWLSIENPDYLMIYPSVANELLRFSRETGLKLPALREMRTLSEVVTSDLRQGCKDEWGTKLVDLYSAIETGYIALQCPEYSHYHVQGEGVLVEILDNDGRPCPPGEIGRVVITCLHNFAAPLIRYEIGDLAVVGEACPCGRGLPVIERIFGRYRNLLVLPDGRRVWPEFGHRKYVVPVTQIQMVQTSLKEITVRLVTPHRMTTDEQRGMNDVLHKLLGYPFNLTYEYAESLRRSNNGKFEEFISLI